MTTGSTDPELYRGIVQVLVAEYECGRPPSRIEGVSRDVLACAWGFYSQINRLGRAALLLTDNGMGHETHVLARVALEHAVLLHWVIERRDKGVAAILASQSNRVNQSIKTAREAQMVLSPEIEREMRKAAATGSTNDVKAVGQFKTVCKDLALLELYFVYGVESSFIHPTVVTINSYLNDHGDLTNEPQRVTHEGNLALVAHCLIWANRDLDSLTPRQPRADELERLARSIQAAPVLPAYRPVPPAPRKKKRGRGGRRR